MTGIHELLRSEHVALNLKAKRKREAIERVVELLARDGTVDDADKIVDAVFERERVSSTGIGDGVAIPHRLADWVGETTIAFGRFAPPVGFGAIDGRPVDLLFLILGPEGHEAEHLKLLSRLARLLRRSDVVRRLRSVSVPEEIVAVFREAET